MDSFGRKPLFYSGEMDAPPELLPTTRLDACVFHLWIGPVARRGSRRPADDEGADPAIACRVRREPHYNRGMSFLGDSRRRSIALLAVGLFLVVALFVGLNAFNTTNIGFLNPETSGETLVFTGVIVLIFLVLMAALMLLARNILRLYASQSSSALGARLRTRMVLGAALIALIPAVFMFLFSLTLMNRSIDRWFSRPTSELREDSTRVVLELAHYVTGNARVEAESIAASGAPDRELPELQDVLGSHRITLAGGFVVVYGKNMRALASFQAPPEQSQASLLPWLEGQRGDAVALHGPFSANLLSAAQRSDEPVIKVGDQEYALGMSATASGKAVVAALPMPRGLSQTAMRIRSGADEYWRLFRSRNQIRTIFFLVLLVITVIVFFCSVWLAHFLSRQITQPVEALADAMDEIAAGKYDHRVALVATGEMGDLVRAFNRMAADLDASRQLVESSSAQLTAANLAIEERRRESETIVETIPSGVVTLDGAGFVLKSNRAFAALIGGARTRAWPGSAIDALLPAECAEDLAGVIRRGQRMGAASTEIDFNARGRTIHLAVTSARLELAKGQTGTVLVVEDTTELLRAQRQLAWKEVAQRVAHEIKNPLTPIALSAERIAKHLDRGQPDSPNVIRKCSEVILGCVGTLAHAGGPVLGAGAVSRAAAAGLRFEPGGGGGAGAVCRPARRHYGAVGPGAGFAHGAGRSRSDSPRHCQPDRQCRRGHAGQPAARARDSQLAQRGWRGGRVGRLRHRPRPDR